MGCSVVEGAGGARGEDLALQPASWVPVTHSHVHTCMHAHILTHIHTCALTLTCTHSHTRSHTHALTCPCTHTFAHVRAHTLNPLGLSLLICQAETMAVAPTGAWHMVNAQYIRQHWEICPIISSSHLCQLPRAASEGNSINQHLCRVKVTELVGPAQGRAQAAKERITRVGKKGGQADVAGGHSRTFRPRGRRGWGAGAPGCP